MRRAVQIIVIIAALLPTSATAQMGGKATDKIPLTQTTSTTLVLEKDLIEEREVRREAEHRASIAEAKTDLIEAANNRLENWIAIYGVLIAVVAIFAGLATRSQAKKAKEQAQAAASSAGEQAARAAKLEMLDFRQEAEAIMQTLRDKHGEAVQLTESLKQKIDAPPSTDKISEATTIEKLELKEIAEQIDTKPKSEWTAEDYRILLFDASSREDWERYVKLAHGMAWAYEDSPTDLGFALFAVGFGQNRLGEHEKAATAYQNYLARCPGETAANRAGALSNWGRAISEQARKIFATGDWAKADQLWALADEKYQAALTLRPDNHDAFNNWGGALYGRAQARHKMKDSEEADRLWALAGEKYQAALAIKSDKHEASSNWGNALAAQAQAKQEAGDSEEADRLWVLASEKYQAAVTFKPDMYQALCNWGSALAAQANAKSDSSREELFDQADKSLQRANEIAPGSGSYNLACLAGLRGDAAGAAQWLRDAKAKNRNCPNCTHIHADHDFDQIRNTTEFRDALADIGCGQPLEKLDNVS